MTFEQLEYFIKVVEHDTFFDAAETLHTTQSTLSKQILKLEKELGVKLLDRSHRNASLTDTGELFYKDALKLTWEYHQMLLKIRTHQGENQTYLRIGTLPILAQYQLTSRLKEFKETSPHIFVDIDEVEEMDLMNGLESEKYDLIIARQQMVQSKKIFSTRLTEDELVVVLPNTHPLCHNDSISLAEIADEVFILMNRYTCLYTLCMHYFKQAGIIPNISRTARVESIISALTVGEGISLLARSNLELFHHENIAAVPLRPSVSLPVVAATKKKCQKGTPLYQLIQYLKRQM